MPIVFLLISAYSLVYSVLYVTFAEFGWVWLFYLCFGSCCDVLTDLPKNSVWKDEARYFDDRKVDVVFDLTTLEKNKNIISITRSGSKGSGKLKYLQFLTVLFEIGNLLEIIQKTSWSSFSRAEDCGWWECSCFLYLVTGSWKPQLYCSLLRKFTYTILWKF